MTPEQIERLRQNGWVVDPPVYANKKTGGAWTEASVFHRVGGLVKWTFTGDFDLIAEAVRLLSEEG